MEVTDAVFDLDAAVALATTAHSGQTDKAGESYIGHPLRVMARVTGDDARMVAVLHDVIEDTPVTAADLLALGCPTLSSMRSSPSASGPVRRSRRACDESPTIPSRSS